MNKKFKNFKLAYFGLCLILNTLFSSCTTYHFANPLPIDSKNIYKTPKKLRGFVVMDAKKNEGYFFEKHSIKLKETDTIKIINGIWFSAGDTSRIPKSDTATWKKLKALPYYESMYSIRFDSIKKLPVDTIRNYVIKGDRIYYVDKKGLSQGISYTVKGDTIYAQPQGKLLELGPYSFFRKVSSDTYLLNTRDGTLEGDFGPWWQVFLITKRKNEKVIIHDWDGKISEDSSLIYSVDDHHYFDSKWTRKDILRLIKEGMFEPMNEEK